MTVQNEISDATRTTDGCFVDQRGGTRPTSVDDTREACLALVVVSFVIFMFGPSILTEAEKRRIGKQQ
jgi:hypothetical protein